MQEVIHFFRYQRDFSVTHGLQHFCFLGRKNLYQISGIWKMKRHIWSFFFFKKDFSYLDVELKVKYGTTETFAWTMGEADFNRIIRLTHQLVIAAKNFGREENLWPVLIPTMSKDMHEQFKLAYKVIDLVHQAKRKIFVTLQRYIKEELESSYAQVRFF